MWSSIQVLPSQVSKKSFYTFEDIDLWESHAKVHKKPSETLEADSILTDFRCILHSVRLQKWKLHLLSFKTSPYRKILAKNYLF